MTKHPPSTPPTPAKEPPSTPPTKDEGPTAADVIRAAYRAGAVETAEPERASALHVHDLADALRREAKKALESGSDVVTDLDEAKRIVRALARAVLGRE